MATDFSSRPYLIRAIYEWCVDQGFTPHIAVAVNQHCQVPMEYVREGEIILNIGPAATPNLKIDNDWVQFSARFSGVAREIWIPVLRVMGIYAKENGQGLFFGKDDMPDEAPEGSDEVPPPSSGGATDPKRGKPSLRIVK